MSCVVKFVVLLSYARILLLFGLLDLLVALPLLMLQQLHATATASAACYTATSPPSLFSSQLLAATERQLAKLLLICYAQQRRRLHRACGLEARGADARVSVNRGAS